MAATTTQLSPNSQSVVTMTATTASIAFQILPKDTSYWAPSVSISFTKVVNSSAKGNNVVTFAEGLAVTLSTQGAGGYNVFVTGNIIDGGDTYPVIGAIVGTYTPPA